MHRKRLIFFVLTGVAVLTVLTANGRGALAASSNEEAASLLEQRNDLPIGTIRTSPASEHSPANERSAKTAGTVVLIPQIHKEPGSQSGDRSNDDAEVTQREIHSFLPAVLQAFQTQLVAVEGVLTNEIQTEKAQQLAAKIHKRNSISAQLERAHTTTAPTSSLFAQLAQRWVAALDRDILLAGAPQALQAEGTAIEIIGVEQAETREQAAAVVREYIYLQDRIKQLESSSAFAAPRTPAMSSLTPSGTRVDNPYRTETNISDLRSQLAKTEADIQRTVIDRRNQETASVVKQALQERNASTLVLQFGAGHTEGMVAALHAEGLNVIVIEPRSVTHG